MCVFRLVAIGMTSSSTIYYTVLCVCGKQWHSTFFLFFLSLKKKYISVGSTGTQKIASLEVRR